MKERFDEVFSVDAGKGTWRKFTSCIMGFYQKLIGL